VSRYDQLELGFKNLHATHPEIYDIFEKFTFDLIGLKFKRYSADAVMHRVRWETEVSSGGNFKINNNFVAFYARLFMQNNPQHAGFFETRVQGSK